MSVKCCLFIIFAFFFQTSSWASPPQGCASTAALVVSWNIPQFEKLSAESLKIVAETINDASIVGFQGLSSSNKGLQIMSELDIQLSDLGFLWDYSVSEGTRDGSELRYVFLWKTRWVKKVSTKLTSQLESIQLNDPFIGAFKVQGQSLALVNFNLIGRSEIFEERIKQFLELHQKLSKNQGALGIFGFWGRSFDAPEFAKFKENKLLPLIKEPGDLKKNATDKDYLASGFNNVFFQEANICATGVIDIVPSYGLGQVQKISSHLPLYVWVEL
ncbi:MAG: hypothetical protein HQM11_13100 [SAR324 cluster bacterium]|nr:hypothetical protein [SAR324 cluster bacterium]